MKKRKKEKLHLYGVRLREDQIQFLRASDDAAKVIRQIVDDYILKSGKPDIFLINQKIAILNRRSDEILNSGLYKACKFNIKQRDEAKHYGFTRRALMSLNTLRVHRSIVVDSEDWKEVIDKSIKIFNKFNAEGRKIISEIKRLQDQLITLPE